MTGLKCLGFILVPLFYTNVAGRFDGCPMYGCRPSGSFSVSVKVPERNATIAWINKYFLGPIPNADGCVGNSVNLVCQSNGPGPADTGLKSYDLETGAVKWRDFVLRFPAMPVMDITGQVWGSDGSSLVSYTAEGVLQTKVSFTTQLRPLYGLQITGGGSILLVSETGKISTFNVDGALISSMYLRGSVERANGTFIPTASPVVDGNRFYVITEFVPEDGQYSVGVLGLQRLYAIDTSHSSQDSLDIAWYANFEKEGTRDQKVYENSEKEGNRDQTLHYQHSHSKGTDLKAELIRRLSEDDERRPTLLWDNPTGTVFIALPPPALTSSSRDASQFVGVKDTGNDSSLVFRSEISVVNMAQFEANLQPGSNAMPQLWGSLPDGRLVAFRKDGSIDKQFDMSGVFKTNFTITTKISVTRPRVYDEDFLIFGIHVTQPTTSFIELVQQFGIDARNENVTSYVVALDTPENKVSEDPGMPVKWMVPCPEGSIAYGQIVGIPAAGNRTKDQLVVFSQIEGKFGKVFAITEK